MTIEPELERRPVPMQPPGGARLAGLIWALFGVLVLIAAGSTLAKTNPEKAEAGPLVPVAAVMGGVLMLAALAFIGIGVETIRGRIGDTKTLSSVSFLVSMIMTTSGVMRLIRGDVLGCLPIASAVALIAAGLLLFSSRREYLAYREGRKAAAQGASVGVSLPKAKEPGSAPGSCGDSGRGS